MGWDNFASLRNEDKDDRTILAKYGLPDIPYILHVGTVEPRKNLLTLLEALQQLRAEGAARVPRCVLVGRDGWRSEPIRKRLKQTKNEGGTVYWFTDVSDAELPAFYRGARCTVVPSYSEGWGLPVQESLAYGVPCIASRIGGLPEAGKDLAVYFDPAQPDDLAKAIKSWILNDAALAEVRSRIVRFLSKSDRPTGRRRSYIDERTDMRSGHAAEPNGPTID
jgi:glycosyltransferase involved in cell wall biosynthesis